MPPACPYKEKVAFILQPLPTTQLSTVWARGPVGFLSSEYSRPRSVEPKKVYDKMCHCNAPSMIPSIVVRYPN